MINSIAWALAILLTFGSLGTTINAQTWQKSAHFDGYISNVTFVTPTLGFVGMGVPPGGPLSCNAAIYRTSDAGVTWTAATIPESCVGCVTKIFMADEMNGWASVLPERCPNNSCLWKTTDGGLNWTNLNVSGTATSVYRTPSALICTDLFAMGKSSVDGGASFNSSLSAGSNDIDFVDDLNGIATVYRGQSWQRTSDGGKTWNPISMNIESWSVYAVKGTNTYYAAPEGPTDGSSYQPQVLRSSDGGTTWTQTSILPFVTTGTLVGIGESELFVQVCGNCTSQYQGIYHSTNQGVTWTPIGGPSTNGDTRFCTVKNTCEESAIVYAFDLAGNLFRYSDSLATGEHSTAQVYPNPRATLKPFTQARVPVNMLLPKALRADTLNVTSIEFSLKYNSNLIDIIPSKLNLAYTPPQGWVFNPSSSVGVNGLKMYIDNPSKLRISDSLPLGVLAFGTYPATEKSTQVTMGSMTLYLPNRSISFCLGNEGDFIITVVVEQAGVGLTKQTGSKVSVHPNPSMGDLHVTLNLAQKGRTTVSLIDLIGNTRYEARAEPREAGEHRITIPTTSLSAGTYYLRIEAGGEIFSRKVTILK